MLHCAAGHKGVQLRLCHTFWHMAILAQHAVALISAQLVDLATAGMLAVCDMTQSSVRVVVSVWGMCRERGAVAGKGPPQPLNGHA